MTFKSCKLFENDASIRYNALKEEAVSFSSNISVLTFIRGVFDGKLDALMMKAKLYRFRVMTFGHIRETKCHKEESIIVFLKFKVVRDLQNTFENVQ